MEILQFITTAAYYCGLPWLFGAINCWIPIGENECSRPKPQVWKMFAIGTVMVLPAIIFGKLPYDDKAFLPAGLLGILLAVVTNGLFRFFRKKKELDDDPCHNKPDMGSNQPEKHQESGSGRQEQGTGYNFYYGRNSVTGEPVYINRAETHGYKTGVILGARGSGVQAAALKEIRSVLENTNDTVIILDTQMQYGPIVHQMGGEVIKVDPCSEDHQKSFFDIDPSCVDLGLGGAIHSKVDLTVALLSTMPSDFTALPPSEISVIDMCVKKIYKPFLESYNPQTNTYDYSSIPTLMDLKNALNDLADAEKTVTPDVSRWYSSLISSNSNAARRLADSLEALTQGIGQGNPHNSISLNSNNRLTVYQPAILGSSYVPAAMLLALEHIWQTAGKRAEAGINTWMYFDEPTVLTQFADCSEHLSCLTKRARVRGIIPTFISRDTSTVLRQPIVNSPFSTCSFAMLLSQSQEDCNRLLAFHPKLIGKEQYILEVPRGEGLLYDGNSLIPFTDPRPYILSEEQ